LLGIFQTDSPRSSGTIRHRQISYELALRLAVVAFGFLLPLVAQEPTSTLWLRRLCETEQLGLQIELTLMRPESFPGPLAEVQVSA